MLGFYSALQNVNFIFSSKIIGENEVPLWATYYEN
jgi:hypothetical protein